MKARSISALVVVLAGGAAQAQFSTDMEALEASPEGSLLTGQDGYYIPVAGSTDFRAFTYLDNTLGVPQNPDGGAQFVAGEGLASPAFARAQRDITWPTGTVEVTYDVLATYTDPAGVDPTNNVGSFSIQPGPGSAVVTVLFSWTDTVARTWQIGLLGFDAAGVAISQPGVFAGPEWQNLSLNTWYRVSMIVDFNANRVMCTTIVDLSSGSCATTPVEVYLEGGAAGGLPHPTAFRFFGGGGTAGNVTAWDNLVIEEGATCPECPDTCYADCDESGGLDFFDFLCFQNEFATTTPYADCDESGGHDFFDFLCFQNAFAEGCP